VRMESLAFGGDGVARHEGRVVFVPFTAPGELVEIRILHDKKNFVRAEVVRVVEPAPGRVEPRCPVFGRCGGCQYQHLAYDTQVSAKSSQVRETLQRLGGVSPDLVAAVVPSPAPWSYRNRISVHVEQGQVGFRGLDNRSLVEVSRCHIASDAVNAKLAALRSAPGRDGTYSLREDGVNPQGFAQCNAGAAALLRECAVRAAGQGERLFEGFCGSGFFTELLASAFREIAACDSDERLIRQAPRLPGVRWHCLLAELLYHKEAAPVVFLDPPRDGLPEAMTEAILRKPPTRLVYVSCNPATLARDAKRLAQSLRVVSVTPFDLFPQTAHIECVAVLELGRG